MPDLTAAMRFHKEMAAIETSFIREGRKLYAAFRRDALDEIDRVGLASLELPRLIRSLLNALAAQIRQLAQEFLEPLARATDNYARRSLQTIRTVEPRLPGFAELTIVSIAERQRVAAEFLETAANFVEVISARFLVGLDEARQQTDDPQAVRRLMSPELVDGRASVYRHGSNTLRYESQRKIWIAGMGLAAVYFTTANQVSGVKLQKQAVATIDSKTTPCCLDVHGQIKDIDEPFQLSGQPCGGGRVMHPPFPGHQCRTVESPYVPVLERSGLTTGEMIASARAELGRR